MLDKKLETALKLLKEQNVKKRQAFPGVHRLLWKVGVNVPPPHFNSFVGNSLFGSIFMFVFMGLWMNLFVWLKSGRLFSELFFTFLGAIIFGIFSALLIERKKAVLDLPKWEDLD